MRAEVSRRILGLRWPQRFAALALVVAAIAAAVFASPMALASPDVQPELATSAQGAQQSCLGCHGNKDLAMTFPNGDKLSLYVDVGTMAGSVHEGKLICTDCHSDITGFPHKSLKVSSKRDFSIAEYEA